MRKQLVRQMMNGALKSLMWKGELHFKNAFAKACLNRMIGRSSRKNWLQEVFAGKNTVELREQRAQCGSIYMDGAPKTQLRAGPRKFLRGTGRNHISLRCAPNIVSWGDPARTREHGACQASRCHALEKASGIYDALGRHWLAACKTPQEKTPARTCSLRFQKRMTMSLRRRGEAQDANAT